MMFKTLAILTLALTLSTAVAQAKPTPAQQRDICQKMNEFARSVVKIRDIGGTRAMGRLAVDQGSSGSQDMATLGYMVVDLAFQNPSMGAALFGETMEAACLKTLREMR